MDLNGATLALGAFFSYYFILSGWYGLHRSMIAKPFKLYSVRSKIRFSLNLLIVFLEFYLVALATGVIAEGVNLQELNWSENAGLAYEAFRQNYVNIFTWLIPSIFGVFLIWDLIKFSEHGADEKKTQKVGKFTVRIDVARIISTGIITIAFIVIAYLYSFVLPINDLDDNLWIIIISFVLVFIYRVKLKQYRDDVELTFTISPSEVRGTESFQISGELKDISSATHEPLSSKKITFTSEPSLTIKSLMTDEDGRYSNNLNLTKEAAENPSYTITALYEGSFLHEGISSEPQTLKVIKIDTPGAR
jgi:hypothetical protein